MDTEFLNRLAVKNTIYNLSRKVENDFYHQYHDRYEAAAGDKQPYAAGQGSRVCNSLLYREKIFKNSNHRNWGLKREKIDLFKYEK